jgi:DNA modification methylase
MKIINPNIDRLCINKKFAKNDTSYTSFWLYNKDNDILSEDFKDKIIHLDKDIFSEFNPTIAKNIISYWSNERDIILDPFSGRTRGFISGMMNRKYIGFEIVKDTFEYLIQPRKSDDLFGEVPYFINDDSNNIDKYNIPEVDFIFTCPPYWCLEKYKNYPGELSNIKEYNIFLNRLVSIFNKSLNFLKKDGYMAIVIGDFRYSGQYVTLHSDLIQALRNNKSIDLHDIIAVQNIPFHIGAIYFGNMKKVKKVSKVHEYILIYKKT